MRVATDPTISAARFQLSPAPEGLSAFGNGEVYVEKYLERPRHIEYPDHGRSPRRRQSARASALLRATAAPEADRGSAESGAFTQDLSEKMGEAAVKGAKAIDYVGAGTIEMLPSTRTSLSTS